MSLPIWFESNTLKPPSDTIDSVDANTRMFFGKRKEWASVHELEISDGYTTRIRVYDGADLIGVIDILGRCTSDEIRKALP